MPHYKRKKPQKYEVRTPRPRLNQQIKANEVRLLDVDGTNVGVVPLSKALELAHDKGLDLVEVSGKATPPITRIADYGKYLYALEKKNKEDHKKQQHKDGTKNMRLRIGTHAHDLEMKAEAIDKFMQKGYKVQVEIQLRGREKAFADLARKKMEELLALLKSEYKVEKAVEKSLRGFLITISK